MVMSMTNQDRELTNDIRAHTARYLAYLALPKTMGNVNQLLYKDLIDSLREVRMITEIILKRDNPNE